MKTNKSSKPNKANIKVKAAKKLERQQALANELFPALFAMEPDDPSSDSGLVDQFGAPLSSKYEDDFDIRSIMNDAEDPDTGIIRDLRIDDRDLPSAKNYYDYALNIIGRDANPPWIIQMWIGLMLFAETCPRCSDKRWYDLSYIVEYVDKRLPSENISEHLQLLENGTCPKCKTHKYELIKKHGLKNYQELVNVLGQRSGKSSSCAGYSSYLDHRYLKYPNLAHMTNAMQKSTELTGTFVSLTFSKAFGLLWTPFINIIRDSSWFCLAEGTQISLASGGTCAIENVAPGDVVTTFEGSQPVLRCFDNGVQDCFDISLANSTTVTGTAEHQVQVLSASGDSLVWRRIEDLAEGDLVVVQ